MAVMTVLPKQFVTMFRDYSDSWTSATGQKAKVAKRRAAAFAYLVPFIGSAVFVVWRVQLPSVTPLLTAMSVFTALLFGLLFLVFNLAVTIRKDGSSITNSHGLRDVVDDLRATVTYTIFVAVVLVIILAVASFATVPADPTALVPIDPSDPNSALVPAPGTSQILPWPWTPVLAWLGVHLVLNLFKVLERFRTAYNYISR